MMSRAFTRSMASAAKTIKPPIQLFGVEGTYANALYSASVQESSVENSFNGLTKVSELIKEDPKVNFYLTNPGLSKDDRKTVIETLTQTLGLDNTVSNFLGVLSDNNRLGEFDAIYKSFGQLNDAHQGIVEATITSSKALESKILRRLQAAIQKSSFVGSGKTLKLSNEVNPDILGGLIVDIGDKTVDLSVASKVSKLNSAISESL